MLEIGSVVDGKYRILNKIGQGGMSVVYLAMNEKANKAWAIKEVRKDGVKDFEVVKQGLVVETDLLKRLKHPNLPSIIDVIDGDGRFLIVMDYIEGNPLSTKLEEEGAQPQELVIEWAKQLCNVLGYLHSRNPAIIYRDMKPANVMLQPGDREDDPGKVTLIDFGTAREFKERNLADTVCLGTIGYAAPEQYGGHGQTNARTDIYCLGATMYHLVTGRNPSEPPYEMKPIRDINPVLSSGLEQIILKCTKKNPEERYQSCAELMYALEHYDEMDERYRKKQVKRLAGFLIAVICSILSLATGIIGSQLETAAENSNYGYLIDQAGDENIIENKISIYKQALEIRPNGQEALMGLIEAYRDDGAFTVEEDNDFKAVWETCKVPLEENRQVYRDICFEVGKLYWYYYSYGLGEGNSNNQSTRMKSARNWFNDVVSHADSSYENYDMAVVYASIGEFYANIQTAVEEADDSGMYGEYWRDLTELAEMMEEENTDKEIVSLEMYRLIINSIENYAVKFRNDQIEETELRNMMQKIEELFSGTGTEAANASDKIRNLRESITGRIEAANRAVETAYLNQEREQE